jgi:hypothetical protein
LSKKEKRQLKQKEKQREQRKRDIKRNSGKLQLKMTIAREIS